MTAHLNNNRLFEEFPPVATADWEKKIIEDLKGADYNKKLIWQTREGFALRPYYRDADLDGLEYLEQFRNEHPGIAGRQDSSWLIRQDIPFCEVDQANVLAREAIKQGADIIGFNASEITTHKQMSGLLQDIDIARTRIFFTASKSFPLTAELFFYEVSARGIDTGRVRGGINFDPLGYMVLKGDFYISFQNNIEEAEYLLNAMQKRLPSFRAISVNGHFFQNSGSTLVQELAFSLASGNQYLSSLTDRGFSADLVSSMMQFHFATGPDYFMEMAKLRAARILWAKIVEQYNPSSPDSLRMYIHSSTATWNQTVYDHYLNMLRSATESMSAAIGQADSISVNPFDLPLGKTGDFASRIARNQQLILKEESYLDKTSDPASGAYFIENLTHHLCSNAWDLFRRVEAMGGMKEALMQEFIQDEVAASCRVRQSEVDSRKSVLIGTNQFPDLNDRLEQGVHVETEDSKTSGGPFKTIKPIRVAKTLERIRLSVDLYAGSGNKRPEVYLLAFGNPSMMRARAGFALNFLGCAGFGISGNQGSETIAEALVSAVSKAPEIIVLCSSDEDYSEQSVDIVAKIRESIPGVIIVLAGNPSEKEEFYKNAGIEEFIHLRSNLLETLNRFCLRIGVPLR